MFTSGYLRFINVLGKWSRQMLPIVMQCYSDDLHSKSAGTEVTQSPTCVLDLKTNLDAKNTHWFFFLSKGSSKEAGVYF